MLFTRKKLSESDGSGLLEIQISSVKPYSMTCSPVYVFLEKNQKFVSIKAPFEYFTEEELKRIEPYKAVYLPKFIETLEPFRKVADHLRQLFESKASTALKVKNDPNFAVGIPRSPFEISSLSLKVLGPIWWKYPDQDIGIEPFLVAVFINELFGELPKECLGRNREVGREPFDWAILISSWTVFLAIHLGYCDFGFLSEVRVDVFNRYTGFESALNHLEVDEMTEVVEKILDSVQLHCIKARHFRMQSTRVCQKLSERLDRIRENYSSEDTAPPTIFGEKGFIDE